MIWVLQPLLGTSAQAFSPLIFGKSCPAQPCFQSSEREGEVVFPSPWTFSNQRSSPYFLSPSLSPRLSSPVLLTGPAEFSRFTGFPCPSPPDGQSQSLNTQL